MALNVRTIKEADIESTVKLCRMLSDEAPAYRNKGFNEEKTRALITAFAEWRENLVCYVVDNEGEIVGILGLVIMDSPTHDYKYATDVGFYIKREYRGSPAAVRMIRAAETLAKTLGASEINIGASSGINMEKTVYMYEKMGYTMASYGMVKEL